MSHNGFGSVSTGVQKSDYGHMMFFCKQNDKCDVRILSIISSNRLKNPISNLKRMNNESERV